MHKNKVLIVAVLLSLLSVVLILAGMGVAQVAAAGLLTTIPLAVAGASGFGLTAGVVAALLAGATAFLLIQQRHKPDER